MSENNGTYVREILQDSEAAEKLRARHDINLAMLDKLLDRHVEPGDPILTRFKACELLVQLAWKKRLAGLVIMGRYCKDECRGDSELVDEVLSMAQHDQNDQVRGVALHTLGRLLEGSRHLQVGKYLANLIATPSSEDALRSSAFLGLWLLHGRDLPLKRDSKKLLEHVDQQMLDFYLK